MKKSIFCCLLCFLVLFSASCTISLTSESEETPMFDNIINPKDSPYYFILDEDVKESMLAYFEKTGEYNFLDKSCYYGEHEGKHVFFYRLPVATVLYMNVGDFKIETAGSPYLLVWDGEKVVWYEGACNVFGFEASREIALIHCNHSINGCLYYKYCVDKCAYEEFNEVEELDYMRRWSMGVELPNGGYELANYCSEQTPLFEGKIGVLPVNMGLLPGEFEKTKRYVLTVENVVDSEEKFTFYGVVADVEEMFQITEDMWLESYEGFNQTDEFDLEKAKALKYCVPIKVSAPSELNVEVCLVADNLKNSAYVLVFNVNEQTGEKYISQVYEYQKTA